MKKLFIVTLLLSANLFALNTDEAHSHLLSAQKDHKTHLAETHASEAHINNLKEAASRNPSAEANARLNAAINAHSEKVDKCKVCVHGLQELAKKLNAHGHHIEGDVFSGRIQTARAA